MKPSLTLEFIFLNENEYDSVMDEVKEKLTHSPKLHNIVMELLTWGREEYREGKGFVRWLDGGLK